MQIENVFPQSLSEGIDKGIFFLCTYRGAEALSELKKISDLALSPDIPNNVKRKYYMIQGEAFFLTGDIENAFDSTKSALDFCDDGDDKASVAASLAGQYFRYKNYAAALEFAKMSLMQAQSPEFKIQPLRLLGQIEAQEEKIEDAFVHLNEAAQYAECSHCIGDFAITILSISELFAKTGRNNIAISELMRAEGYAKDSRNLDLYRRILVKRANLLFKMGWVSEGIELIEYLSNQDD